jgi:DNA-binding protein HU-beta
VCFACALAEVEPIMRKASRQRVAKNRSRIAQLQYNLIQLQNGVKTEGRGRVGCELPKQGCSKHVEFIESSSARHSPLHPAAFGLKLVGQLWAKLLYRNDFKAIGAHVIKLDIINEVVTKTGVTKTKAEMAVETVFESMKKALSKGDRIELRGFGVFNVRPRKTGIGRNPRTGAEVSIPPGKAVRFKPGKELQSID